MKIIAASQRPAQVDKDFLGGCTYIRCFTLRYPSDRKAMAGAMDVPLIDIACLQTIESDDGNLVMINYIERDFRSPVTKKGQVKLRKR